jgi:hypothetical protein
MKRLIVLALLAGLALAALAASGCTMTAEDSDEPETMVGLVTAEGSALIEASDQIGAEDSVLIDRVVAPDAAWIVVHLDDDGAPGMRVGLAAIDEGESTGVIVDLDGEIETNRLIVAVHGDRGVKGEFEFSMDDFEASPDKPFFVNGEEVATSFAVR